MAISHERNADHNAGGADLTIDLTADDVDDLALVIIHNNSGLATLPEGWTEHGSNSDTAFRQVASYKKQSGDEVQTFDVPGAATISHLAAMVFRGADFGEITTPTNQSASGTALLFDALTVADTSASVLLGSWSGSTANVGPPSGYTENDPGTRVWMGLDLTLSAGELDPANATISTSVSNRIGWHVELTETAVVAGGSGLTLLGVG